MEPLNEREMQILELVAEGLTDQQIGDRLSYSRSTIKNGLRSIYFKFGLWGFGGHSRVVAAVRYTDWKREAPEDAERGRWLVDRMFELPRPSPEWEQALAELRVWSMKDHNPGGQ
jgi:hypothetical protein